MEPFAMGTLMYQLWVDALSNGRIPVHQFVFVVVDPWLQQELAREMITDYRRKS